MKLFIITDYKDIEKIPKNLVLAANKQNVEYEILRAPHTEFLDLPKLEKGDAIFRLGITEKAKLIECTLLRDDTAHFYRDLSLALCDRKSSYFANYLVGLPTIKTATLLPLDNTRLSEYVDYLGGFPFVVKIVGGSKGVGVMRADSFESLKSMLDYVRSIDVPVQLRQYIPHTHYARLVVVGDEVVGSHCTYVMDNEFRTNAAGNSEENKKPYTPSEDMVLDAIKAVHSTGVKFGGVDLLITENGNYFIAEVNFPCGFGSTERIAKVDIANPIIKFLKSRSEEILSDN